MKRLSHESLFYGAPKIAFKKDDVNRIYLSRGESSGLVPESSLNCVAVTVEICYFLNHDLPGNKKIPHSILFALIDGHCKLVG
ncbi:MAG: hypothetical protein R6W75_12395 [Smithellaceae bacterium]